LIDCSVREICDGEDAGAEEILDASVEQYSVVDCGYLLGAVCALHAALHLWRLRNLQVFTIAASRGLMDTAGFHIRNNLRTWQVHATAALLFVAIGPFQFNASFRNKHPVLHKRMGYLFALCTVATAVTGGTTLAKATEFGAIVRGFSPFMSVWALISLAISIADARNKRFQSHRRWILRSAAMG